MVQGEFVAASEPERHVVNGTPAPPAMDAAQQSELRLRDRLWVIVTCMGRLPFVKRTAPALLAQAGGGSFCYCLVDFSCPDHCGDWLERAYPELVARGGASVVRVLDRAFFHKTAALNLGACAALEAGARALCFADADTLLRPGAIDAIAASVGPGRFLVADRSPGGASVPSLTGLLGVAAEDFRRAGGFDETFEDWGSEDIEMRLRLHLVHGIEPVFLPADLFSPLGHGNWLRTRFYRQLDIRRSAARNGEQLRSLVRRWTGRELEEMPETAQRLLFDSGVRRSPSARL
jgi:hypothetical protein